MGDGLLAQRTLQPVGWLREHRMRTVLHHLDLVEGRVRTLPVVSRIAFAAACAERMFNSYRCCDAMEERVQCCRAAIDSLWSCPANPPLDLGEVADRLLAVLPDPNLVETLSDEVIYRTVSALHELLSVIRKGRSDMAYLASQANLDILVAYDRDRLGVEVVTAQSDVAIEQQPLLREEMSREAADLDILSKAIDSSTLDCVRQTAQDISLLGITISS